MKKIICYLLIVSTIATTFFGCSGTEAGKGFIADNEIFTYEKIDSSKTQIVVSRTGNINVEALCNQFEELNPDVQVIYLDITGGNSSFVPLKRWITSGYAPDVVISAASFFDEELTVNYFENLSANPILQNYEAAALQRTATGNDIYWLPGPSEIAAMMYNKTLFSRYGWQVPTTFDEFVALCDRITNDTNGQIEPWNPNAKYSDELTTALECMTYAQLFAGMENYEWYNGLYTGESTLKGHMEPYTDVIKTLIDHNILKKEHFTYSATTRGKEFAAGNIAMISGSIYDADNDEFDFGYMAMPTTKGDLGYLCNKYSCFVGLPLKERTDKESDAVHRFLEYFSSPQGQTTIIADSIKISNVKDMSLSYSSDLKTLQPILDAGHLFTLIRLDDPDTGESVVYLHRFATEMVLDGRNGKDVIADMDEALATPVNPEAKPEPPEVLANVEADMTVLETSFYMADAYREAMDADIGLIQANEVFRGNLMRLFEGDINADMVTVLKPRSFGNGSALIKASMTGKQLLDALNNPAGDGKTANCIYAYSGLKCKVAPWNELGKKYISVQLMDGSDVDPEKLYTVAFWQDTVQDEYITEILQVYDGTWEDMMTDKLRTDGTVVPADDGRIELVWQ